LVKPTGRLEKTFDYLILKEGLSHAHMQPMATGT